MTKLFDKVKVTDNSVNLNVTKLLFFYSEDKLLLGTQDTTLQTLNLPCRIYPEAEIQKR